MIKKIRLFTTFTGIGSPEMALRNIGINYELVGMSEVDKNALIAYDAIHNIQYGLKEKPKKDMIEVFNKTHIGYNFSTDKSEIPRGIEDIKKLYDAHIRNKNWGDIRLIDEKKLPDFDLFTYSYPCKSISIIGKQEGLTKGSGTQSSLLWECERIIREKKPKYLLMENVKNLVGKKHLGDFELWINTLKEMGYHSTWKVLNGSNFGVPQNRERVIMISILNEEPSEMSIGTPTIKNLEDISLKETLSDKIYYTEKQYIPFCDLSKKDKQSKLVMLGHVSGKVHSNMRIYSSKGYCPTLNSMNGGNRQPKIYFQDLSICRKLTPKECWRLMGYSDTDYIKAKDSGLSDSKLYERAGRGIIVPMLEEVFKGMLDKEYFKQKI